MGIPALPGRVESPGSLPARGMGDDTTVDTPWMGSIFNHSCFTAPEDAAYRADGNIKVPFCLQPDKYFADVTRCQRDIEIPRKWGGRRIVLTFERTHWKTSVWPEGRASRSIDSLSTPHLTPRNESCQS